jgi:hypothetical protein
MSATDLSEANLSNAFMWKALLGRAILNHANFTGAVLLKAWLSHTLLMSADQTVVATGPGGATVTWPTPPTLPGITPDGCDIASGSTFPIGQTSVRCHFKDSTGTAAWGDVFVTSS